MKMALRPQLVVVGLAVASLVQVTHAAPPAKPRAAAAVPAIKVDHAEFINEYCTVCHSAKAKTAGLSLEGVDPNKASANAAVWEKVIRKVRTGSMPPQGMPAPEPTERDAFVRSMESTIDRASKLGPGRAPLHRLNRTEYENAVRDVLGLKVDAAAFLPPDDESYGFDNIADVLKTSPLLLERYMSASWKVSRLAVGNPGITPDMAIFRAKPDLSQHTHMPGLPIGTRGGIKVEHNFPLDGEYDFRIRLWRVTAEMVRGLESAHQMELSVDGERIKVIDFGGKEDLAEVFANPGISAANIDKRMTVRAPVKAGRHTVIATFLNESEAPDDGILQPFEKTGFDVLDYMGYPVVDRMSIQGPFNPTGSGDSQSRQKIFTCRPAKDSDELPCARKIIGTMARTAYRKPISETEMEDLLGFYQRGRNEGGNFDSGVEAAIQLILANPKFIFRSEADPATVAAGATYRLGDMELASRLSFFLWSTVPDEQLITLAQQGRLHLPTVLDAQVKRMLADARSNALIDNFAGQWLYLRNLKNYIPDFEQFPDFDDNLRQAMRRETELFFESILRENRPVLDLLTADYTFVNERLARHYGIPKVYGNDFRRIQIADPERRGILGQASILTVTSLPTRTSPVQRGKWILSNLLGTPPTPPPPNVPALKGAEGKPSSLRERMEQHRANAFCSGCHKVLDPIGFALENFDGVGQWRTTDGGVKIDPSGTLFTGDKVSGASDLRKALTAKPEIFAGVFTERLMTYALGRGVQSEDMPVLRTVMRNAAKDNYRISTILMGIIKSAPFQMKTKAAPETDSSPVAELKR
jgi:Protein of unknown function (DUF1592)/Protein of unknown function (DUF1588)/Protein of unknown function (DUF1587)/Protein of unknown function (DUF1585)/Protein of unknown function (DUF1595)